MAKGNYAAYQQLTPINIDWADIAKQGVDAERAYREKKEAKAEKDRVELDSVEYEPLSTVVTGVDSLDQAIGLGLEEAGKINQEDFKRASTDIEFKRSSEYKIRSKNIQNYTDKVKTLSSKISELATTYAEKERLGQLSDWDDSLGATLNGAFVTEKVVFKADKKTGEPYAIVAQTREDLKTGKDGDNPHGYVYNDDGSISMKKVSPNEVFKGLGEFRLTPKVDIATETQKFGQALGKNIKTDIDGNMARGLTITKAQAFENVKEKANAAAMDLLGSAGSPTDLAKNIWADKLKRSKRELNESDMIEIRDSFVKSSSAYYDETEEKSYTQRAPSTPSPSNKGRVTPSIPNYVVDTKTGSLSKSSVTVKVTEKGQEVNKTFDNLYEVQLGGTNGVLLSDSETTVRTVKNFYVDEEGNTFADVVTSFKPSGRVDFNNAEEFKQAVMAGAVKNWETEVKTVKLSNKDFQAIATNPKVVSDEGHRFTNGKQFLDYLSLKRGATPSTAPPKKGKTNSGFDVNSHRKTVTYGPQEQ